MESFLAYQLIELDNKEHSIIKKAFNTFRLNCISLKHLASAKIIQKFIRTKYSMIKFSKIMKKMIFKRLKLIIDNFFVKKINLEEELKPSLYKQSYIFSDRYKFTTLSKIKKFTLIAHIQEIQTIETTSKSLQKKAISRKAQLQNIKISGEKLFKMMNFKQLYFKSLFINSMRNYGRIHFLSELFLAYDARIKSMWLEKLTYEMQNFKLLTMIMKLVQVSKQATTQNTKNMMKIVSTWVDHIRNKRKNMRFIELLKKQSNIDYLSMINEIFSDNEGIMNIYEVSKVGGYAGNYKKETKSSIKDQFNKIISKK